jgi:DNA-binding CsgD family transcriptional regulator
MVDPNRRLAWHTLNPRELELVELMAIQALSCQEIAHKIKFKLSTAKSYVMFIYHKLGVKNRYELIVYYWLEQLRVRGGSDRNQMQV